ncbi:hypothetical protein AArcSl_1292 [Halalkaliarchaeum desulfuricum]|uniref:Uncharacterized protein n=1 Tax=Halalkaliarchaeum desulfuricum TaxID=2055893 RepID=A0A343TIK1_9EURY|nr:hypothetical protein [Halalkaliarchaeum desulfuricum]AUX08923.1 hypothetical protein AArcSl_1292 [Halalkaliarchaeum desulfuricum]
MAWDEEKEEGDELPSDEWNDHVDDQLSRALSEVQEDEPSVGNEGDLWARPSVDESTINPAEVKRVIHSGGMDMPADFDESRDLVYVGVNEEELVAYDATTLDEVWTYDNDYTSIDGIAYNSQDDSIVLIHSEDIEVVDPDSVETEWKEDVGVFEDGIASYTRGSTPYAATVDFDENPTIHEWDLEEESLDSDEEHDGWAWSIGADEFEPDLDPHIIIGNDDGTVDCYVGWGIYLEWSSEDLHDERVRATEVDSEYAVTGSDGNKLVYFDLLGDEPSVIWEHEQHTDRVYGVSMSDEYVFSTDQDNNTLVTDRATGTVLDEVSTDLQSAGDTQYAGSHLFVGNSAGYGEDSEIFIYEFEKTAETYVSDGDQWRRID